MQSPKGCDGAGPSPLCTKCHLGWAQAGKASQASRSLHKLFLQPGVPLLLDITADSCSL